MHDAIRTLCMCLVFLIAPYCHKHDPRKVRYFLCNYMRCLTDAERGEDIMESALSAIVLLSYLVLLRDSILWH